MTKDGFPHAVAVWLGMAFATALSLFDRVSVRWLAVALITPKTARLII